jgi:hypothetical protein
MKMTPEVMQNLFTPNPILKVLKVRMPALGEIQFSGRFNEMRVMTQFGIKTILSEMRWTRINGE